MSATRVAAPAGAVRLEPVPSLAAARATWTDLAERSGNVFSTWEWADTWWRHFGGGRRLRLFAVTAGDGRPVALLPLYEFRRRPVRILRFVGHGPGDELGPVCATADRALAAEGLRAAVRAARAAVLVAEQLPAAVGWDAPLGGPVLSRAASPVVDLGGGDWEALVASWSRKLRKQVRSSESRLGRDHDLRYRLGGAPGTLAEDLEIVFRLHAATREPGESPFIGAHRAFHRDFARVAAERGWLRLWFLEAEGRPVAAEYVFRYGGADSAYQSGRDPAWQQTSPGVLLTAHAMREAIADGIGEYRLLRGDEPYKLRFATNDPGLMTVAVPGSRIIGASLRLRAAMPADLEARLRRWARR